MKLATPQELAALRAVAALPVETGAWAAAVAARESQWQSLPPRSNQATGVWQITPGVLSDYAKATGTRYTVSDMLVPEKALEVWVWYWDWLQRHPRIPALPEWAVFAWVIGVGNLTRALAKAPVKRRTMVLPWVWQRAAKPAGLAGSTAKMQYVREVSDNANAVLKYAKDIPMLWPSPAPYTAALQPAAALAVWKITRPRPGTFPHAIPAEIEALVAASKKLAPEKPWVPSDNWSRAWAEWATANADTIRTTANALTLKYSGIPFAQFAPAAAKSAQQALKTIKSAESSIWAGLEGAKEWLEAGAAALVIYALWRASK